MMFIRRASESFYKYSKYEWNEQICEKGRVLFNIKEQLDVLKDEVSEILYKYIRKLDDDVIRRKTINFRRKIYHNYNEYGLDIFDLSKIGQTAISILERDIDLRRLYTREKEEMQALYHLNNSRMSVYIQQLLENKDMMGKIYATNKELYTLLKEKRTLKKSQYITLLKYLYKQENCCTPSALWSGIGVSGEKSSIFWGEAIDKKQYCIWGEKSRYIQTEKNKVKSFDFINEDEKMFFVNLTMFKKSDCYMYIYFDKGEMQKRRIVQNDSLNRIYKDMRYKLFSLKTLKEEVGVGKEIADTLIKTGIICNKGEKYATYELENIDKNIIGSDFDYYTKVFNNIQIEDKCEKIIEKYLEKAALEYAILFNSFYQEDIERRNNSKARYFEGKRINLLQFLYEDFEVKHIPNSHFEYNYRAWRMPNNATAKERYCKFINYLRDKIDENEEIDEIYIKMEEMAAIIPLKDIPSVSFDIVFQYDLKNNIVIPEMCATQKGRLLGRYIKYFNEGIQKECRKWIDVKNENGIQINIELHHHKDNLGYQMDSLAKELLLYDFNKSKDETLFLEDVYISGESGKVIFSSKEKSVLDAYCTSSISPGRDKIYGIINSIEKEKAALDINGQGFSRIELNLDYQPRIVLGNFLLSRKRIRIERVKLVKIFNEDIVYIMEFKEKYRIFDEFYLYCDTDYKPRYGRLSTEYDMTILRNMTEKSQKYVYFEEVYPNKASNDEIVDYNFEIWRNVCLN